MRFIHMHENSDLIVVTPQYYTDYGDALKRNFPNHDIEVSTLASNGSGYFFNKENLKKMYESKIEIKSIESHVSGYPGSPLIKDISTVRVSE